MIGKEGPKPQLPEVVPVAPVTVEAKPAVEAAPIPPAPPTPEQLAAIEKERTAKPAQPAEAPPPTPVQPKPEAAPAPKPLTPEWEKKRAERLGFEEPKSIKSLLGKGVLDTLGSVFGARLAWEAPKLIRDYFKKKEQRGKISDSTIALLGEAQSAAKVRKEGRPEGVEELASPVQSKIKALNEQLKEAKLPAKEKLALRKEMAKVLNDYRKEGKNLDEAKTGKVGKVLDLYINNSAQRMVVAREAVNTASIMVMMPWLRAVGYSGLAFGERAVKAAETYEKEHFQKEGSRVEKLGFLAKNLTVDAARETFNGLTLNYFNKETKGKLQTTAEAVAAYSKLLRAVGLIEFEAALRNGTLTMQEGADKFWGALKEGKLDEALKQGGENWANNAQRLLSYIGLSENPEQAARKLVETKAAAVAGAATAQPEGVPVEKAAEVSKLEHLKELATVKKGEGITHSFVRQLEADPAAHGYSGNLDDKVALHRWAQKEAYSLAVRNGYINVASGEEVRVRWDVKNPSAYLLKGDSVEEINPHKYMWNPQEETKAALEKVRETDVKIAVEMQGSEDLKAEINKIYKGGWFGLGRGRMEEWEAHRQMRVQDVIAGKFKMVGENLEGSEVKNQHQLQEYVKEMVEKSHLKPTRGETVEAFLARANSELARQDITAELDGTKATLQDVKSIFKGKEDEEVWKVIKKVAATDAEKGEFGHHVGKTLDMHEEGLRTEVKKLIEKMHRETGRPINPGESVEDYLKRSNRFLAEVAAGKRPTAVLEAAEAKEAMIKDVLKEGGRLGAVKVDNIPVVFRFNDKHEVIGVGHGGNIVDRFSTAGRKLFKGDWLEAVREKSAAKWLSNRDQVVSGAAEVAFLKKVLAKLTASEGESPRAKFLAKHIADTVLKLEKKYGDVFK